MVKRVLKIPYFSINAPHQNMGLLLKNTCVSTLTPITINSQQLWQSLSVNYCFAPFPRNCSHDATACGQKNFLEKGTSFKLEALSKRYKSTVDASKGGMHSKEPPPHSSITTGSTVISPISSTHLVC